MTLELRIELLKLTKPNFDMPDIEAWIARAKQLEEYVTPRMEMATSLQADEDKAFVKEVADRLAAATDQHSGEMNKLKRSRAPKL